MHILIVTQYFWPENFKINDLAIELNKRGHEVTVLTGLPNYPEGKIYKGFRSIHPFIQNYDGVKVIRVPLFPRFKGKGWQLFLNYISFAFSASLYARFFLKGNFDKIFVFEISPITVGFPAISVRRKFKIPIFFWVLDLWPESVYATSPLSSTWISCILTSLVKYIYRRCDSILISSQAFRRSITDKGISSDRISYFPNWAEDIFINPKNRNAGNLTALPTGFKILFAGNIGDAQDFETILSAANILRNQSEIKWIVVGDGRKREWLTRRINELQLGGTVKWLGKFPIEDMPAIFEQADVMLLSLKDDPIFSLTVPAKLQTYLASKKPIVGAISGEGGGIIREAKAGFSCESGDKDKLAENIMRIYTMSNEDRLRLTESGYDYYLRNFEKNELIDSLVKTFENINYSKIPI